MMNFKDPTPDYVYCEYVGHVWTKIRISVRDRKIMKMPIGLIWLIPNFDQNFGINQGWLELNQVWSAWVRDK